MSRSRFSDAGDDETLRERPAKFRSSVPPSSAVEETLTRGRDSLRKISRAAQRSPAAGVMILHGGAQSSLRPDTVQDNRCDHEAHEGRM
jgi:hypothetical protein